MHRNKGGQLLVPHEAFAGGGGDAQRMLREVFWSETAPVKTGAIQVLTLQLNQPDGP